MDQQPDHYGNKILEVSEELKMRKKTGTKNQNQLEDIGSLICSLWCVVFLSVYYLNAQHKKHQKQPAHFHLQFQNQLE